MTTVLHELEVSEPEYNVLKLDIILAINKVIKKKGMSLDVVASKTRCSVHTINNISKFHIDEVPINILIKVLFALKPNTKINIV